MSDELLVMLPMLLAVGTGAVTAAVDAFFSRRAAVWTAVAGLVAAGCVAVWDTYKVGASVSFGTFMGGIGFAGVAAVILFLAAATLAGGSSWFSQKPGGGLAASIIALCAAATIALSSSADLLMTLLALETIAICAYGLLAQARTPKASEAGIKYLIQGAVAGGFLIVGIGIVMTVGGGATNLFDLQGILGLGGGAAGLTPLAGAMGLIVASLAYKLGAFPFHSWAPDTFESAPSATAGFMSGALKVGAVLAAYVLTSALFTVLPPWTLNAHVGSWTIAISEARVSMLWAVLAAGSIVFGNLGALRQTSFGRLMGYSGIAQVGYVLVGLTAGPNTHSFGLLLTSAYAVAVLTAFLGAEAVRVARPAWDGSVAGMAGFGREHPVIGVSMAAALFSLTGIPLTAGFWGKLLVFGTALAREWEWLVVLGVLGSVVSFGYYGRVLRSLFFDAQEAEDAATDSAHLAEPSEEPEEPTSSESRVSPVATAVIAVLGLVIVAIGVTPLVFGLDFLLRFFTFAG